VANDDFGFFRIFGPWIGEESNSLIAAMESKRIDKERRTTRTLHIAKQTEEANVDWISKHLVWQRNQRAKSLLAVCNGSSSFSLLSLSAYFEIRVARMAEQALFPLLERFYEPKIGFTKREKETFDRSHSAVLSAQIWKNPGDSPSRGCSGIPGGSKPSSGGKRSATPGGSCREAKKGITDGAGPLSMWILRSIRPSAMEAKREFRHTAE
jgi:hypothetical protein